jgi:hypothetical protein
MKNNILLAICLITISYNQILPTLKIEKKVSQVGRFELMPYAEELKDIAPSEKFNVLDCYLIINNKTNQVLRITLFQRKDYTNKASEIVAIQDGRESYYKLPRYKITGFALPKLKWCERIVFDETELSIVPTLESLKTAPIIGFSISKPKEDIPIIPEYLLPKDRPFCITYLYDIIPAENRHGYDIKPIVTLGCE